MLRISDPIEWQFLRRFPVLVMMLSVYNRDFVILVCYRDV